MEFLIIVCSSTLQEEMNLLFEKLKITGYTLIPEAEGTGKGGGTRLNDETWPGENNMYLIAVTTEQATEVKAWVREYRKGVVREGLKLFSLAMNEMI